MKYLVAGASTYGVDNMGDDAMLSCLIRAIRMADPKNTITFLARHPETSFDELFGVKSIKNLDHASNEAAKGRVFLGFNAGDDRENLRLIRKEFEIADILVIGGNSLMEISENGFLRGVSSYATTLATFSLFMGKQYALFGLNIVDPINSNFVASQAKFLIENAAIVTAREDEVVTYLQESGVDTRNVCVTGDPAYGVEMERVFQYRVEEILMQNDITLDPSKKTISICMREDYWRTGDESIENLEKETCKIMRQVLSKGDTQILFIPNAHYEKGHPLEDDRMINRGIKARFGNDQRVHYMEKKLNLYETLSLFGMIDLHISNRRHSNVFAALFGKPFIPINTSLKTHMSAFLKDLGQTSMLVSDREFSDDVLEKYEYIIDHYEMISARLRSDVKINISRGLSSATKITSLIQ